GEVFVAANEFRIREIKRDDPSILYSDNLFDVARERGWWSPSDGPLDWLRTVSLGEYNHPYYSLRRVWRVQSKLAPSLNLSPWVEDGYTRAYPFSVKPDEKLTVRDVMNLYRDHYEGTQFDMTEGVAAGPFGYPNRYYGPYDGQGDVGDPHRDLAGAWERPLSVAYCGYTFVNQARGWLPDPIGGICWFGPDKPAETCFVPFYVGVSGLPEAYSTCDTDHFSRESAWWAFNFVANWSALKYSYMHQDIKRLQDSIELGELEASKKVDERAGKLLGESREAARRYLTEFCTTNAQQVVSRWWEFSEELIVRYNDGYINSPGHMAGEVGYPKEWLKRTDYYNGPTTYKEPEK
ncbi:MAG: C69 family dipeptidase, partial [Synergistales bacterium]|nr:C69 family dipeptidase [Synergistales bacterium]